jgi:hypothetical protein
MASRAIPGTLKTIEGFHYVDPDNRRLKGLLAQGYCQYASGFIEDEYEQAEITGDREAMDYHARRVTNADIRCMNYALELIGGDWKQLIAGDLETIKRRVAGADADDRDALMWAAVGLGGMINFNKDDIALVSQVPKVRVLLDRVLAIDAERGPPKPQLLALPHLVLAMVLSATSPALGGNPELAAKHFKLAFDLTKGRFLLARVLFARRYAVATQNRELFHKTLTEVLETDPAIWPEQRLANEIAHRRARRYLTRAKEWF